MSTPLFNPDATERLKAMFQESIDSHQKYLDLAEALIEKLGIDENHLSCEEYNIIIAALEEYVEEKLSAIHQLQAALA